MTQNQIMWYYGLSKLILLCAHSIRRGYLIHVNGPLDPMLKEASKADWRLLNLQ